MTGIFKKVKPAIHENTPSHGKSWFGQKRALGKVDPGFISPCLSPLGWLLASMVHRFPQKGSKSRGMGQIVGYSSFQSAYQCGSP